MEIDPTYDGVAHINVYSKGRTELGRLLSNFAYTPFTIPFLGMFNSVEGFWYYILTGNNVCRALSGWQAKDIGRKLPIIREVPTKRELKIAYKAKMKYNPIVRQGLLLNDLPLVHYYVYGDKIVVPEEWQWTATLWEEIKKELI